MRIYILLLLFFGCVFACREETEDLEVLPSDYPYHVIDDQIHHLGVPVTFKGVNALQTFGLVDQQLLTEWNVEIIREFIGNLREQPIDGNAILASDDVWYHSLQKIVDHNRANERITILCPFGWVDEQGASTLFTGLNPADQEFYSEYLIKMRSIAAHFSDQPDVWIEVWNEPYHWQNKNGYSHNVWLRDMNEMVDNLRSVAGFDNIIVVPGNEQGQSESSILQNGTELLEGNYNIVFDLHAYEKWLIETSQGDIEDRIEKLKIKSMPILFGEIGVENSSGLMDVDHFLDASLSQNISTLGWLWNKNSDYSNALLDDDGLPNDQGNLGWGSKFKNFLAQ